MHPQSLGHRSRFAFDGATINRRHRLFSACAAETGFQAGARAQDAQEILREVWLRTCGSPRPPGYLTETHLERGPRTPWPRTNYMLQSPPPCVTLWTSRLRIVTVRRLETRNVKSVMCERGDCTVNVCARGAWKGLAPCFRIHLVPTRSGGL